MAIAYCSLKNKKKPATVTTYDSRKEEAEIQLQGNNYSVTDHFSGPGTAIGPVLYSLDFTLYFYHLLVII